jgi:hypothetical protein
VWEAGSYVKPKKRGKAKSYPHKLQKRIKLGQWKHCADGKDKRAAEEAKETKEVEPIRGLTLFAVMIDDVWKY